MLFGPVGILGKEEVGATLIARVNGVVPWDKLQLDSESFVWRRDGNPIENSNKVTYKTSEEDIGKKITVDYSFATTDGENHIVKSSDFIRIPDPRDDYWNYLYNKYLGREPDAAGLKWWQDRVEELFKDTVR